MSGAPDDRLEQRLLILAPVGKDAALIATMLGARVHTHACGDLEALGREVERGAAAILLTEEALAQDEQRLAGILATQGPWSDLPVLLLTRQGADSAVVRRAIEALGNVTLLERPVRIHALASAVRSALRARDRQYHMRAYLEERELADRRKDEFIAALAHELRNPLAPIRNSIELLKLSGEKRDVVDIMGRQVTHLVRLVDDLMEISRMTRGRITLRKNIVSLAAVIEAAVEMSRPLIEARRHTLTVDLPSETVAVEADTTRLTQIFSNLLNNAANYTDPGGSIALRARREGGQVAVTVSDTGIGIAAEALSSVFDMFAQVSPPVPHPQSGLGIGLALARGLVAQHGGTLTAASGGPGMGSQFTVRLPVSRGEPRAAPAAVTAAPALGKVHRVLVVDDNRDAADSLGALLQMLGAEVRVVHDGESALAAFGAFQPRVTLLDLGMPGMDGYEVARRIRARPDARGAALIALTGWGQERDRRRTAEAGFDGHLTKPVDIDTVAATLASVTA